MPCPMGGRAIALDLTCAQSRASNGRGHAIDASESLDLSQPSPKDLESMHILHKIAWPRDGHEGARRADALDSARATLNCKEKFSRENALDMPNRSHFCDWTGAMSAV